MLTRAWRWLNHLMKSNSNGNLAHTVNQEEPKNDILTVNLHENLDVLKAIFDRSSDIVFREFQIGDSNKAALILLGGLVDLNKVDENVLKPLFVYGKSIPSETRLPLHVMETVLQKQVISMAQVTMGLGIQEVVDHVLSGDTILLIDGERQALFIGSKSWETRSVEEPATEANIRGPREGFVENLSTNISLIRRRLKTSRLKMESMKIGSLSKTDIVITYLEGIADDSLVVEVVKRLNRIEIDAILDSGYIEELIEDNPLSIFTQVLYTERPDKLVGNILEGKVGIIVDNTPFALIVPGTFFEMLQSSDDYYTRYIFSTAIRWLRLLFFGIALLFPSIYIALTTFHHEMLPTSLLLSIANSRETVPFPALVEALLMEISFEGLREAGVRMPRQVGQAVSIVGALVIGQAAVQAGLVSAPLVIVVSITGIASFIIPNYSQGMTIRLLRFLLMLLAGILGLFGILMGGLIIMIHMAQLRSFGVPYLSPVSPMHFGDLKDVLVRAPWWGMRNRPTETGKKNIQRMGRQLRPKPPNDDK